MRTVVAVQVEGRPDAVEELRGWLQDVPELRGCIQRNTPAAAPAGAMGSATDSLIAVLEPGGVAAVFAGALVAWVQSRRRSHTVTVTRPDGSRIEVSTQQVRGMSSQDIVELVERLERPAAGEAPPTPSGQPPA